MAAKAAVAVPQLQAWRLRRFLSPSELAAAAKVQRRTIWYAERGNRVHMATARKLAEALGIEPAQLCDEPAMANGEAS